MKRLFTISTLLFVSILAISGVAFGWGAPGGDGSRYTQLQELAVFYNNSGVTLYHGDTVILDSTGTSGTTLGSYVTRTASADSILVVGVVANASPSGFPNGGPVVVVTKGPALTTVSDATDAVTTLTAVGTTTSFGSAGGGTNLGIALEGGDGTDGDSIIVWVAPAGSGD